MSLRLVAIPVLAEMRVGYRWATGDVEVRIGAPGLPEFDFDSGSVFGSFLYDSLDNLSFRSECT